MPIIRIEMLPGRSKDTKQRIAAEMTQVLVRELGAAPSHIYVMFNEVLAADWAVAGAFLDAFPSTTSTNATTG